MSQTPGPPSPSGNPPPATSSQSTPTITTPPGNPTDFTPEAGPPPEPIFKDTVEHLSDLDDDASIKQALFVPAAADDAPGKPPKPIMGEVIALSKDTWSA